MASGDKAPLQSGSDLDTLIHSLEFENQQYVKMIEKENQRVHYLETQDEEKNSEISQLQSLTAELDSNTKRNHKQLVHNKNTLESLVKTKVVLVAHLDALQKQMELLQLQNKNQQDQFEETLQMYEAIWSDYKSKYMSLPLAQKLVSEEARLARSQVSHSHRLQQKQLLQQRIQAAKDERDFQDWHRFCVKIAEKKLSVAKKLVELENALKEKMALQTQLQEIREKNVPVVPEQDHGDDEQDQVMEMDDDDDDEAELDETQVCVADTTVEETTTSGDTTTSEDTLTEDTVAEDKDKHTNEKDAGTTIKDGDRAVPLNQTYTIRSGKAIQDSSSGHLATDLKSTENRAGEEPERMEDETSINVWDDEGKTQEGNAPQDLSCQDMASPPQKSDDNTETDRASRGPANVMKGKEPKNVERSDRQQKASSGSSKKVGSMSIPLLSMPKTPSRAVPSKIPTVKTAVSAILTGARPMAEKVQVQLPKTPLITPRPAAFSTLMAPPKSAVTAPTVHQRSAMSSTPVLIQRPPVLSSPAPPQKGTAQVRPPFVQSPARVSVEQPPPRHQSVRSGTASYTSEDSDPKRQSMGRQPDSAGPGVSVPPVQVPAVPAVSAGRGVRGQGTPRIVPASPVPPSASHAGSQLPRLVRPVGRHTAPGGAHTGRQTSPTAGAHRSPPVITVSDAGDSPHEKPVKRHYTMSKESPETGERGGESQDEDMDTDMEGRGSQPCLTPPSSGGHQGNYSNAFNPFDLEKHQKKVCVLKDSPTYMTFTQKPQFAGGPAVQEKSSAAAPSNTDTTRTDSPVFQFGFNSPSQPGEQSVASLFSCAPSAIPMPDPHKPTSPDRSERGGSFFSFESMDTSESTGGLSLLSMFGKSSQEKESTFSFNFSQSPGASGTDSGFSFSFGGGGGGEDQPGSLFSLF